MLKPKCIVCGQPAALHETAIIAGEWVSRHFCREHGEPFLPSADPAVRAASLRSMEEYYRSLSDAEREEMALTYRLMGRMRRVLSRGAQFD